jgi:5-methyltetrahydrofolate--homocysteine methyltransferase
VDESDGIRARRPRVATVIRGRNAEVRIEPGGPVIMIGEKINPTGHKRLAAALKEGALEYVRELAERQLHFGAHVLDVNVGVPGMREETLLPEIVELLAGEFDVPLCIDSGNPAALAAGLKAAPGKPLVNSVNGEKEKLEAILPIVRDRQAAVIGLTMDDQGIPNEPERRLAIAEKIVNRAEQLGIPREDVLIDTLVLTVGADQSAAVVSLKTIELVRERLGLAVNLGASNVSFGLPDRHVINQAFMAMAIRSGAACVITDPVKMGATVLASDLLLGRDPYGKRYLVAARKRQASG